MSRIRSIKPEFWTSEQVVECSLEARLLFIGLWSFCDDAGRMPAKAKQIKMKVFPGDNVETQPLLDELSANRLIRIYEVDTVTYLEVTGWEKHQRIDRPTYRYPDEFGEIPAVEGKNSQSTRRTLEEHSTNTRRALVEASPPEGSGGDRKGKDWSFPRKCALPSEVHLDEWLRKYATDHGCDPDREWETFVNHAQSTGRTCKNWSSAFRNWILKAEKFRLADGKQPEGSEFRGLM